MIRDYISLLFMIAIGIAAVFYFSETRGLRPAYAEPTADSPTVVNVYSARKEELIRPLFDAFTAKTGITVQYIVDDAPKLIARLEQEGEQSPADLLIASDVGNLWQAAHRGLLQPLNAEQLEAVPVEYRDPDGQWVGLTKRLRLLFTRTETPKEHIPGDYAALSDPAFEGDVLVRSSSNIYNQSLLAAMIHDWGAEKTEAWAKGLVHNVARTPQGGDTDQLKALAAGEGNIAIANHYYYARLKASANARERELAAKIMPVLPDGNAKLHANLSGTGITKHARNKQAAKQLIGYMLSPEGQAQYAALNYELPVVPGIAASDTVAFLAGHATDDDAIPYMGPLNAKAVEIADRAGWR